MYAYNSNIIIGDGSEFNSNTASEQGGAISLIKYKISINNSNFYWNSAATFGGASKFKYNCANNGGSVNVFKVMSP